MPAEKRVGKGVAERSGVPLGSRARISENSARLAADGGAADGGTGVAVGSEHVVGGYKAGELGTGEFWFESEDLALHKIVLSKRFWQELLHQCFFPLVFLVNFRVFLANLKELRGHKHMEHVRLGQIANTKALRFLAGHMITLVCAVLWQSYGSEFGLREMSDVRYSEHLVRNLSLILPMGVYLLFHAAILLFDRANLAILFQRHLAVPPTLLLRPGVAAEYPAPRFLADKMRKKERGPLAYEAWQETLELCFVDDLIEKASATGARAGTSSLLRAKLGQIPSSSAPILRVWARRCLGLSKRPARWAVAWNLIKVVICQV